MLAKQNYINKKSALCLLALTCISLTNASWAQNTLELKPISISAPDDTSALHAHTDSKKIRLPIPAPDAADYLKTFPGFAVIRNGGANGDPVLRSMFGSRLGILSDGALLYGGCGGRMDPPSSYINPELYDEVSIIKGPQSVKFGSGFSAGVVNYQRKFRYYEQPTSSFYFSTLASSQKRLDFLLDSTLGNHFGYINLQANHAKAGDFKDGNGDEWHSKWKKWNANLTLGLTPNDSTNIELFFARGNGYASYATRGMDGSEFLRQTYGVRFDKFFENQKLTRIQAQIYSNYTDHVMDNYSLRTPKAEAMPDHHDHHDHGDQHHHHDHGGSHQHMHADGDHHQPMVHKMVGNPDRQVISARLATDWQFTPAFSLTTGVDASKDKHRGRGGINYKAQDRITDTKIDLYGIFAEGKYQFNTANTLNFGLRLDKNKVKEFSKEKPSNSFDTSLTSAFVRYENNFNNQLHSYIGLGYNERSADFWELKRKQTPSLAAEKTLQLDTGLTYSQERYNLWVSAYLAKINNFMLINYPSKKESILTPISARTAGFELGGEYSFNDQFSLASSLAYSYGKNTSDQQALPQIAPLEHKLAINYQRNNWAANLLLRNVFAQHRIAVGKGNIIGQDFANSSAFTTLSASGAYKINDNFVIDFGVDNIFNKNYTEHLNKAGDAAFGYSASDQINEPGRTFWLKLTAKF